MRTFSTVGIVLKRSNYGEGDRIITVFSPDRGKFTAVAKGVRKTTSTKRSALEPGMHSKLFFSQSKGMPLLTQAQVIDDFSFAPTCLEEARDLSQILEIADAITIEGNDQESIFDKVVQILRILKERKTDKRKQIIVLLRSIIDELGFQQLHETNYTSISEYVEFITEKKLKSFAYLTVKSK